MTIICPTITAENTHIYREQIERVQPFAKRLHIDLMDGELTSNKSIELPQVWWPENMAVDLHLMFRNPEAHLDDIVRLKPDLVIIQAESGADIADFAAKLNKSDIKCGVALLPETAVASVKYAFAEIQHILIFSGNLGHQGGSQVDFSLLEKVKQVQQLNPSLEIAWDGGVNDQNARQLAAAGVNILDVGGFIHTAASPQEAYNSLISALN